MGDGSVSGFSSLTSESVPERPTLRRVSPGPTSTKLIVVRFPSSVKQFSDLPWLTWFPQEGRLADGL